MTDTIEVRYKNSDIVYQICIDIFIVYLMFFSPFIRELLFNNGVAEDWRRIFIPIFIYVVIPWNLVNITRKVVLENNKIKVTWLFGLVGFIYLPINDKDLKIYTSGEQVSDFNRAITIRNRLVKTTVSHGMTNYKSFYEAFTVNY